MNELRKSMKMQLKRQNLSILGFLERPALSWLAQRIPDALNPDRLTIIGFCGAVLAAAAYSQAGRDPAWLWLASGGLILNWLGDSLDGTVARFRKIERPRYGFFLDQNLDAAEQLVIGFGLAVSGLVRPDLVLVAVAMLLIVSIMALIKAIVFGVFAISHGGFGLTEIRVGMILLNTAMFFARPTAIEWLPFQLNYGDVVVLSAIAGMLLSFVSGMVSDLRILAAAEPPRSRSAKMRRKS